MHNGISSIQIKGLNFISNYGMQEAIWDKRTLKERLLSLPWKPFKKRKIIGHKPMTIMLKIGNDIIAAPEIIEQIRKDAEKIDFSDLEKER